LSLVLAEAKIAVPVIAAIAPLLRNQRLVVFFTIKNFYEKIRYS